MSAQWLERSDNPGLTIQLSRLNPERVPLAANLFRVDFKYKSFTAHGCRCAPTTGLTLANPSAYCGLTSANALGVFAFYLTDNEFNYSHLFL